jgi:hypothetical protein
MTPKKREIILARLEYISLTAYNQQPLIEPSLINDLCQIIRDITEELCPNDADSPASHPKNADASPG